MQGRIKLHRKAQSNPISTNLELRGLFTYFLTKANHAEWSFFHWQQKIDLLPWQFIRSMQWIADHFSISKPKAYRLTELLEKSEIVKRQWYSKYTLFTVVNRWLYQSEWNAIVTRSETPPYTNKNDKNEKEIKKKYGEFENVKLTDIEYDKLQKRFSDYLDKIESLSIYIKSKWDKYKDHYATIIARERKNKPPEPQTQEEYIKVFKEIWLLQFRKKYWQDKANEIMQIAI